jgi:hypothetical protein
MKKILTVIWTILHSIGEARAAAYTARMGDLKAAENMLK